MFLKISAENAAMTGAGTGTESAKAGRKNTGKLG
jgi:hypothetical protein